MADTRRAMHVLEGSDADADLVRSLLASGSEAEATIAYSLLRGTIDESELLMLANLREVLAELPATPLRTGEPLDILARVADYEGTGRSYRRVFETEAGVFGLEFVGSGHECAEMVVHTPEARRVVWGDDGTLDDHLLALFVAHGILLDALLEALALLGCPLQPTIYVSADDFLAEHGAAAAAVALDELF